MKTLCKIIIALSMLFIFCCIVNYIADCVTNGSEFVCNICIGALEMMCADYNITYAQINILLFIVLEPLLIVFNMGMLLISLFSDKLKTFILFLLTLESVVGCTAVLFITLYYSFYYRAIYG